ncbi:MAG TPA: hypothetical protein VNT50_12010 [Microbacterium sp.]|uniref:hypothetical protein n=1 Tax=Microbacterium sp. TaxID=51671 RepID=UPI002CE0021F|nr:hypothetical protein [Microbacterium sp.]HWI32208.1 hypothetical protein [Microbacterium sp.]
MALFRRRSARTAFAVAGAALMVAALAGCAAPDPEASSSASPTSSPSPSNASPSPTASDDTGSALELPTACEDIYSDAMLAEMQATASPLNDPGLTMLSTELAAGLEVLDTAPTLRCTWGAPSEFGLSTNVTIVDAEQSASIEQAAVEAGMTCEAYAGGTICRIETEHLVEGDVYAVVGETHYLRDDGWIATHRINLAPEGYTEDIVATLWG